MNKTKLFLAAAGAAACLALPAASAQAEPLHGWSGFYVGAHVGYAWGDEHDNLSIIGVVADKFDVKGPAGGVHAGYSWQMNNFVVGLEGDFGLSDVRGNQAFSSEFGPSGNLGFSNEWQASLRARAGFIQNNWLLYATGGVAFADVKSSLNIAGWSCIEGIGCGWNETYQSSSKHKLTGYTIGLGAEVPLLSNWIARAEVRYTDFGDKTFNLVNNWGGITPTRVRFDQVDATFGVSYRF
jgi:outer membrane immunogenic protein